MIPAARAKAVGEAKSASLAELEAPALEAAKKWKFKPALKNGTATASTVVVPFLFGRSPSFRSANPPLRARAPADFSFPVRACRHEDA